MRFAEPMTRRFRVSGCSTDPKLILQQSAFRGAYGTQKIWNCLHQCQRTIEPLKTRVPCRWRSERPISLIVDLARTGPEVVLTGQES
jgi:hypothetical protein